MPDRHRCVAPEPLADDGDDFSSSLCVRRYEPAPVKRLAPMDQSKEIG
jgi:hypothetical protein